MRRRLSLSLDLQNGWDAAMKLIAHVVISWRCSKQASNRTSLSQYVLRYLKTGAY